MIYSIQKKDWFIFFGNIFGLVLGVFYVVTAIKLEAISAFHVPTVEVEDRVFLLEGSLLVIVVMWSFIGMTIGLVYYNTPWRIQQSSVLVGIISNCSAVSFYGVDPPDDSLRLMDSCTVGSSVGHVRGD